MKKLIDVLTEEGLITEEQLREAKEKQAGAQRPLLELLVEMGFLKEEDLVKVSSKMFGMPIVPLDTETIDPKAIEMISYEIVRRYGVLPLRIEGEALVIATSDPMDVITMDDLRVITGMRIKPVLSSKTDVLVNIEKYYNSDEIIYDLLKNMVEETTVETIREGETGGKPFDTSATSSAGSPVVKLFNRILSDAIKARASDIHIEPQKSCVKVRYRVDGDLRDIMEIPNNFRLNITARAKVMADMDLTESRKPQDGRIYILAYNRKIDLRVATIPVQYGEKIVFRILDPIQAKIELGELGLVGGEMDLFKEAIKTPQGIILMTGPTSSGKTSTIYAALNYLKSAVKNIVTIEDPIEYSINGINQMQLNPVINVTFATGLRSILRQDPNVIFVGEIRDEETADIAFKASLTGHLVFSTLHTNSAVASITRLLDIGLEPYLIASSIVLIVAQRLVKRICSYCEKEEYEPDEKLKKKFKVYINKYGVNNFYRGVGCEKCEFTGYLGRMAIFSLFKFNTKIKELVSSKSPENVIFEEAIKNGLRLLAEAGVEKVAKGMTTLEEVARVAETLEGEETIKESPEVKEAKEMIGVEEVKKVKKITKILIVDDEEHILNILELRLNGEGYEVIKASNGKEAVKCAVREKPDLIIMDIMMPEMNGFEATKILRGKLETAVIPIVMLTAKKDEQSELQGLAFGADDYVVKPFDGKRLLARIKMLLNRRYRSRTE
ncbi:MAG: type II/IV secretion system protein [Candidatus Omnitrophica bacterium]|nr:type II/IV secretion system protein [Candidatus Omnitrophota bacterium]